MSNLLIIEDNPEIAELYGFIFADHETVIVDDVPNALSYLYSHRPDLIITDFHLPSGTGNDIVRYVRQHRALRTVPILGISVDDTWGTEALALGASAFMSKPIEIGQLLNTSRALLSSPGEAAYRGLPPDSVISGYTSAYKAVYNRVPDCRWTGRSFLIEGQPCDQAWLLAETDRLRTVVKHPSQPKGLLLRLIDKVRRL